MTTIKHFIGGQWTESADGRTFETRDPHDNSPQHLHSGRDHRRGAAEERHATAATRIVLEHRGGNEPPCPVPVVITEHRVVGKPRVGFRELSEEVAVAPAPFPARNPSNSSCWVGQSAAGLVAIS